MARSRTHTTMQSRSLIDLSFPWAWFPLDEGGGGGTGTSTTVSNDSRATTLVDFDLGTAVSEQWSLRPGYFTTDGATDYINQAQADDATALGSVFQLGTGSLLLGLQVALPLHTAQRSILHVGSGAAGATNYGVVLIAEASGTNSRILAQVRDDANTNAIGYSSATTVCQDGGASFAVTGITRAGSTATASTAGTVAVGDYVYISESAVSDYNGIHKVTSISAGVSFNFTVVGTPANDSGASTCAKVGTVFNVFFAIDNRNGGDKSATIYTQKATLPGSVLETGSIAVTNHGTVTLSGASGNINPGVWIGRNARSSNQQFSAQCCRRLLAINFGSSGLPSNLATKVLPALHRSGIVPSFEAFNAIAQGY